MTPQTVRVVTSFALLTLACQPAGAQPPVSISRAARRTGSRCASVFPRLRRAYYSPAGRVAPGSGSTSGIWTSSLAAVVF